MGRERICLCSALCRVPGTLICDSTSACATAVRNDAPVGISSTIELRQGIGVKAADCSQVGGGPMLQSPEDLVLFKVKM